MVNASKAQPSSLIQIGPFRRFLPRVVGLAMCGLLIATGVSVGAAGTACACSCVGYTTEEAATQADGVFVARATDKVSAGPDDIYEFAVLEVFKGDVGTSTTVKTSSQGPSCGVSYDVGDEYLLFVSAGGGVGHAWNSSLCNGPSAVPGVDVRPVLERIYGPPHPPNTAGPVSEITWWTRATAVVPLPLMALAGIVLIAAVWRTVVIVRRRHTGR
jgi:hypothetical protein